jgi:ABC-type bacteriocin/lantibiotic exporter with double-glycine peptidase domain
MAKTAFLLMVTAEAETWGKIGGMEMLLIFLASLLVGGIGFLLFPLYLLWTFWLKEATNKQVKKNILNNKENKK